MGQSLGDLGALVRCGRLAAGLPAAFGLASRFLGPLANTYDDVVAPIAAATINDPGELASVTCALRAMSTKIGLIMLGYAWMADCEPRLDLAALAGAVTRLYDDLIDDGAAAVPLDDRLADVLSNRPATAQTDPERLLGALVGEIRRRLDRQAAESVHAAAAMLHEYQGLSRLQRDENVSLADLDKICRGKGAMANLTLCSLVKPKMADDEREIVMALGEALQSLDDYMDVELDIRNGIATLPALGVTTLTGIGLRMRALRACLVARYGRASARPYCGMIYFLLLKSAVGRRLPVVGRLAARLAGRSRAVTLLTRGAAALPATGYGADA
jgi:hypothetical protein